MYENLWFLVFSPLLWWYFMSMNVQVDLKARASFLPDNKLTYGIVIRSAFALAIAFLIADQITLANNWIVLLFIIGLITSQLGVPLPPIISVGFWIGSFLNEWLVIMDHVSYIEFLDLISFLKPIDDHFIIPRNFVALAMIVIFFKSSSVAGATNLPFLKRSPLLIFLVTFSIGVMVIIYLQNITLKMPALGGEWGSPLIGLVSAWILNFIFAYWESDIDEESTYLARVK